MNDEKYISGSEIESIPEFENGSLDAFRNAKPKDYELPLEDIKRQYNITNETLKTWAQRPEASFWTKIGQGFVRTGQGISDMPAQANNLLIRHLMPDSTDDEARTVIEAGLRRQINKGFYRAAHEEYIGTSDSTITDITSAFTNAGFYALQALATGGFGIPAVATVGIVAGIQEGLGKAEEFAETYAQETGDYKLKDYSKTNDMFAVAYGALAGYIESKLGVERLIDGAVIKTGAKKAIRQGILGAAGEGAEEFLQEGTGWILGKFAGQERRDAEQMLKDATTNAIYGALVGGVMGTGMYYVNRRNLTNLFKKAGIPEAEAKSLATQTIEDGKTPVINEIKTVSELENYYGDSFNKLVDKIESALQVARPEETIIDPNTNIARPRREYAKIAAEDIARQILRQANINGTTAEEQLNLSEIDVIDNVVYLRPTQLGSLEQISSTIKDKKQEIKALNKLAKTGAGNPGRKRDLNLQIAVLQKILDRANYTEKTETRARNSVKANNDQIVLENTLPETVASLENVPTVDESYNGDFIYVGNKRLAVNYKAVEIESIIPSHSKGIANPNYSLKELQNRASRGTRTDDAILQERGANIHAEEMLKSPNTQTGAPLVNEKGEVIAGNGRYEIARIAYELGKAKGYRKAIEKIDPSAKDMKNPILVREIKDLTPAQQIAIADASNVSQISEFDHASQAKQDAKLLQGTNDIMDFANKIPMTDRQGLFLNNGRWDMLALKRRYNDAMMMWLCGNDTKTFESLVLMGELSSKVISGLTQVAPAIYQFQSENANLNLRQDIESAIKRLPAISKKVDFAEDISTPTFDTSNVFAENSLLYAFVFGKANDISNFLNTYMEKANANNQAGLFPEQTFSKNDLYNQTLNKAFPSAFENEVAVDRNMRAVILSMNNQTAQPQNTLFQEQFDLANENARLDDIYPEYTGETIEINGVERTVYNSNGDRIAKSAEALRNFWNWFGDSKVVDEQGRPLVVYHTSPVANIKEFDKSKIGSTTDEGIWGRGFYFSNKPASYGTNIYSLYIKSETPFVFNNFKTNDEIADYLDIWAGNFRMENGLPMISYSQINQLTSHIQQKGHDGVIVRHKSGFTEYVVFEPNQIKSTENRGTFSADTGNIYFQSVFDIKIGDTIKDYGKVEQITNNAIIINGKEYDKLRLDYMLETGQTEIQKETTKVDFEKAKSYFGTTKDLNIAGYVLPDGTLLDFSGRKFGASGIDRTIDHREVGDAYENQIDMDDFLKAGAIRIDGKLGSINTATMPTTAQMKVLENIIEKNSNKIYLELEGAGQSLNNVYENTSTTQIKKVIKGYFNKAQSRFSDFLYQFMAQNRMGGAYDPELQTIIIGRDFNTGTLPHEFAHFWLNEIFSISKSNKEWTPEFTKQARDLFNILGINDKQTKLTTGQQEQFARMVEAYIFGLAPLPEGTELPFKAYLNWIPQKYQSVMDLRYKGDDGRWHLPIIDEKAAAFFNAWYSNPQLPSITTSPAKMANTNFEDNKQITPSTPEVIKVREEEQTKAISEQAKTDNKLFEDAMKTAPVDTQAKVAGYDLEVSRNATTPEPNMPEKKESFLKIGRGTNTRKGMQNAAQKYIAKNREHAEEVAFGSPNTASPIYVENDTGIERGILIRELMNEYKKGSEEYAELYNNLAQTMSLAGKTGGLNNDISVRFYLDGYTRLTLALETRAAVKYAGTKRGALDKFNSDIDAFIRERADQILATEPDSRERNNLIDAMIREAEVKFAGGIGDSRLLYQENQIGLKATPKQRDMFIEWANKEVKKMLKASPDAEKINKLITLSEKAQVAQNDLDSRDVETAVAAAKTIREWQEFVRSEDLPDGFWAKLVGSWFPRAMLINLNTHTVNLTTNSLNSLILKGSLAAQFAKTGNKVSKDLIKSEKERIKAIYDATLMNFAQMEKPTSPAILHGESIDLSGANETVLDNIKKLDTLKLLGKEDFFFRSNIYLDALAYIATKNASEKGANANDLFKEYAKINQLKDSEADKARQQALTIANIAVFTQNGTTAKVLSGVRRSLNKFTGNDKVGLGNILAPFLNTPANIVELGAKATFAPLTDIYHLATGQWTYQDTLNTAYFALGVIITMALTGDYEPPYQTPAKYDPQKPYDSFRIAGTDTWVKLDLLGAMAIPARFMLSLMYNKGTGIGGLLNDTPLVGDIASTYTSLERTDKSWENVLNFGANFAYNQASKSVPAIVKQVMNLANPADLNLEQIDLGVKTGIGRKIGRQFGLDAETRTEEELWNDILALFFNRVKIKDK